MSTSLKPAYGCARFQREQNRPESRLEKTMQLPESPSALKWNRRIAIAQSGSVYVLPHQGSAMRPSPAPQIHGQPDAMPSHRTLEIPQIPKEFGGCWEGSVVRNDTVNYLGAGPTISRVLPHTYHLCFQRSGNGPLNVRFHDLKLDADYVVANDITNFVEHGEVVSATADQVRLRETASFMQRILRLLSATTSASLNLLCTLVDNHRQALAVQSSGTQYWNGAPWVKTSWQLHFHRIEEQQ